MTTSIRSIARICSLGTALAVLGACAGSGTTPPVVPDASAARPAPASGDATIVFQYAPETRGQRAEYDWSKAIQSCENVQRDRRIPIVCSTRYVDGVPAMIIGFQGARTNAALIEPMLAGVAVPFCDSAASVSVDATVYVMFQSEARGMRYDCRTGYWFDFSTGQRT